jgi:hypothetical protein
VKVEVVEEEGRKSVSSNRQAASKQASKHVLGLAVGESGTTFTHPSQPEKKRGPRPASTEKDQQKRSLRHTDQAKDRAGTETSRLGPAETGRQLLQVRDCQVNNTNNNVTIVQSLRCYHRIPEEET